MNPLRKIQRLTDGPVRVNLNDDGYCIRFYLGEILVTVRADNLSELFEETLFQIEKYRDDSCIQR